MANIGKYPQVDYSNDLKILAKSTSRSEAVLFSGSSLFDFLNENIEDFRNTYYGPRTEDPFQNPSGEPMKEGDLYYNTVSDLVRVFNGTIWEDAVQADAYTRAESDERFAEFERPRDNLIINGGFRIWQRGTTFLAGTTPAYTADRFLAFSTAATSGTYERSTDAPAGISYSFFNNSTTEANVAQAIELSRAGDTSPIATGSPATLSLWLKTPAAGSVTLQITLRDTRTGGNLVVTPSEVVATSTTWERRTLTIPSFPAANPTNTLIYVSIQGLPTGGRVSGVKFEAGGRATNFYERDPEEERNDCRKYYRVLGAGATGRWINATSCQVFQSINPPMRVSPTMGLVTSNITVNEVGVANRMTAAPAPSFVVEAAYSVILSGFSGATAGNLAIIRESNYFTADAEL